MFDKLSAIIDSLAKLAGVFIENWPGATKAFVNVVAFFAFIVVLEQGVRQNVNVYEMLGIAVFIAAVLLILLKGLAIIDKSITGG